MMNLSVKFRVEGLNLGRNFEKFKNSNFFEFLTFAIDEHLA